jgi:hypothetical protein
MVDPKLMQNSSMKVVDVDLILGGVIAELIGRTISQTRLHSTARHPHRKAMRMVVPPPGFTHHLSHWCPAKFTTPDDEGFIE